MDPAFLNRNVNEGFSGGEKKRNEILQLAVLEVGTERRSKTDRGSKLQFVRAAVCRLLYEVQGHSTHHPRSCGSQFANLSYVVQAEMSILDEIDSGLDIDALRDVAKAVNALKTKESGVLMVTHYKVCQWHVAALSQRLFFNSTGIK
jgi:Fe-S cluster assembly ATP-binding protein